MVLVGYWPLKETESDEAYDRSGNENHGILEGSPTAEDGILGDQTLEFDGDYDYVDLNNIQSIFGRTFTLSFWAKPIKKTSSPSAGMYLAFQQPGNEGSSRSYIDDNNAEGQFRFQEDGSSIGTSDEVIEYETWHFYTLINNANNNQIKVYRDNEHVDTVSGNFDVPSLSGEWNFQLGLGYHSEGTDGGERLLRGSLDKFRIYNRALSPGEVQYLYNVGRRGRFTSRKKQP